jgi:hypothetical protein
VAKDKLNIVPFLTRRVCVKKKKISFSPPLFFFTPQKSDFALLVQISGKR